MWPAPVCPQAAPGTAKALPPLLLASEPSCGQPRARELDRQVLSVFMLLARGGGPASWLAGLLCPLF